jgi:hypothetical protein
MGGNAAIVLRSRAPNTAATAAGNANLRTTAQLALRRNKTSRKRLLARWTTAVAETAITRGKKRAKAGINTVARPNPESNVSREATRATDEIMMYCKPDPGATHIR